MILTIAIVAILVAVLAMLAAAGAWSHAEETAQALADLEQRFAQALRQAADDTDRVREHYQTTAFWHTFGRPQ